MYNFVALISRSYSILIYIFFLFLPILLQMLYFYIMRKVIVYGEPLLNLLLWLTLRQKVSQTQLKACTALFKQLNINLIMNRIYFLQFSIFPQMINIVIIYYNAYFYSNEQLVTLFVCACDIYILLQICIDNCSMYFNKILI